MLEQLKTYKEIIVGVGALVAAVAGWFRPADVTATKNSFDWTASELERITNVTNQNHDDIVALHHYLEGYLKAQQLRQANEQQALQIPTPSSRVRNGRPSSRIVGSAPEAATRQTVNIHRVYVDPAPPEAAAAAAADPNVAVEDEGMGIEIPIPALPTLKSSKAAFTKKTFTEITDVPLE